MPTDPQTSGLGRCGVQIDISAQMRQDELYRATIENCTTERGWVLQSAQKIADEHHAHINRVCYTWQICKQESMA